MQHLRSLARRLSPHLHLYSPRVDVPPLTPEERHLHEQQGVLADAWAARIKERVDRMEEDMLEGLEDLRREVDLATGEAFGPPPTNGPGVAE